MAEEGAFWEEKIKETLFSDKEKSVDSESPYQYISLEEPDSKAFLEAEDPPQTDKDWELAILCLFNKSPLKILSYQFLKLNLYISKSDLDKAIAALLETSLLEDSNNLKHYRLKLLRKGKRQGYKHLPHSYMLLEEETTKALVRAISFIEEEFRVADLINFLYSEEQQKDWEAREYKDVKHTLSQFLAAGIKKKRWQRVEAGLYKANNREGIK